MSNELLVEKIGKVAKITINRPEARNAMNHNVIVGLHKAFDELDYDDDVSVIVIGGKGEKAFTAGFDLKESAGASLTDIVERRKDTAYENSLWHKVWKCTKPIITMIHGYTIGGGITLAMLSDMVFAGDNLKLGNPEVKLGYVPSFPVAAYKLPYCRIRELYLLTDFKGADELKDWNFINRVFPYEKLEEETMKIAQEITKIPLFSLQMCKQDIQRIYENQGFFSSMEYATEMFNLARIHMINTNDFGKGIAEKGLKETLKEKYE